MSLMLAINGAAVLLVSLFAGLFLYRANLRSEGTHGWHLLHAGGSGRGVMLLALAGTIHLPNLSPELVSATAWAIIFFAWASTLAMLIAATTGEHGFGWSGPAYNKLAYALYVMGAIAVFPAFAVLIVGLFLAI